MASDLSRFLTRAALDEDFRRLAQEDPQNSSRFIDVYRNRSFAKQGGGNSLYNREHSWPKSYGFPNDVVANVPYTDCHMLFLCQHFRRNCRI